MNQSNLCYGCMREKGLASVCSYCGWVESKTLDSTLYLTPGNVLNKKYLVGKVLGQGGFGITYLGWDTNLDIRIAIKEFFPHGLVSRVPGENDVLSYSGPIKEQFSFGLESFLREAKTLARFEHHPNIVTVRDFFKENNTAYMVMSFIEGVTLLEYLESNGGSISVDRSIKIIIPVLDALKEVHRADIMHRDISPENIFIDREGRVVLIDFGAARQEMREKSKSLSVILKAGYAPEEQYRSRGRQGPWTDIYAVAATMYRCITGKVPLEAIDRLDEDDLIPPSQLGVTIEPEQEQALFKAMAVKARDRYQAVDEFLKDLLATNGKGQTNEGYAGVRPIKLTGSDRAEAKNIQASAKEKSQLGLRREAADVTEKKTSSVRQFADRTSVGEPSYIASKKTVIKITAAILFGLLLFGGVSFFGGGDDAADPSGPGAEEPLQTYAPAVIAALDADYYIDYKNGTITLGDLPIGARVVDPSWKWEFRTGHNYTGIGDIKPVTWIVVARDHYEGLEPHVTLLSEELIGKHAFDNSTNRSHAYAQFGYNHWGESGATNDTRGLRPWLNSIGIHPSEGFYQAFSQSFKEAVLTTIIPNREWKNGTAYSTNDHVFLPSTTELGDKAYNYTYLIGTAYPYFSGAGDAKRVARFGVETRWYWTRSPDSYYGYSVRSVNSAGEFYNVSANYVFIGVRPALNLKSGILVSINRN